MKKKKYYGYFDSLKAEFVERVFSSRKRVIKFLGICFVPFLYAFVCIWAFWDPIPKIGEAPMAIVSNDAKINFVVGNSTTTGKIAAGHAVAYKDQSSGEIKPIDDNFDLSTLPNDTEIITSAGTTIIKDSFMVHNKTSLIDNLAESWKSGSVENIHYDTKKDKFNIKVNESMSLTNVQFLNGDDAKAIASPNSDGTWNVKNESKYWAQIQMPTNLTADLIGFFDATIQRAFNLATDGSVKIRAPGDFLNDLKQNSMQFWSTYKHNFLFGQFMYIFNEFKSSLLVDVGPQVISNLMSLLAQSTIRDIKDQFVLIPGDTTEPESYSFKDHGGSTHNVSLSFIKGKEYVVRNQEISTAIAQKHPSWTLPGKTVEGQTYDSNAPNSDWSGDSLLGIFAQCWNNLMAGPNGNLIATTLANTLTRKINDAIPTGLGSLTIDSVGVTKLFSTAGNIAGLLEQDGNIIPNTDANFAITSEGAASSIKNYKDLLVFATSTGILKSKFDLVSILSADSNSSSSSYILPFGDLVNPQVGTFNYNLQHNIKAITNLVVGQTLTQSSSTRDIAGLLPDLSDFFKTNIVGSQFNPYGIGLGQFFLCIGLWVGTLTQTFVFDRAKRVKKAKPWAWYLSKTTLMLVTAWLQTTVLMIAVYALGWSVLGSAFGLMYLWMLFTATIFVIIQQALWYSLQDETIGKFLVIILLIINLSAGWGTFPTFMQAPIFNFLSYFAPYTYSMHGQGAIIYSIAVNGANLTDSMFIMQQFGILIIWGVIFLAIGLYCSYQRNRDMLYGTHRSKKLAGILLENDLDKYVNHKTKKVKWDRLPNEEMPEIRRKVKKRYPEEGQYQWYKRWKTKNQPEKPITASDSDDEIMRRND